MAIDTRQKRRSIMLRGCVFMNRLPIPDGSFDQGDRQNLLYKYSGILWVSIIGEFIAIKKELLTKYIIKSERMRG